MKIFSLLLAAILLTPGAYALSCCDSGDVNCECTSCDEH